MKVLLISGIYPPDIGGPATYMPKLARQLQAQGHHVSFFVLKSSQNELISGDWKVFSEDRDQFLPKRVFNTIFRIWNISRNYDVLVANGLYFETGFALRFLKKNSVAKIVGDPVWERARNRAKTTLGLSDFNRNRLTFSDRIQRFLFKTSLNQFNSIFTPSVELSELVTLWGIDVMPEVIPNGVVVPKLTEETKIFDVVSVARLVKWKNIDKLIMACGELNLRLAIVGTGPQEAELRDISERFGSLVEFTGELISDQVNKVLEQSKIFVLLSQYEGLSFSLLEAMAHGLPVIVSNARGNMDVVTHGVDGLIVSPANELELKSAILQILQNQNIAKELGLNSRKLVETKFNENLQINLVISLLEKINAR